MRLILIFVLWALAFSSYGTEQNPDKILIDGEQYDLLSQSPFGSLLIRPDMSAALNDAVNRAGPKSTDNWRGYVANWEVRGRRLLLQGLTSGGKPLPLSAFFWGRDSPADAVWFSGSLLLGKGKPTPGMGDQIFKADIDPHYRFGRTLRYPAYLKIEVRNGYIQAREDYEPLETQYMNSIMDRKVIQDSDYGLTLKKLFECESALEILSKERDALSARLKNDCPSRGQ